MGMVGMWGWGRKVGTMGWGRSTPECVGVHWSELECIRVSWNVSCVGV